YTVIVVIGGDGTFHEAVNGYIKAGGRAKGVRLALIPAGSGNDFCRNFRSYPKHNPSRILDAIIADEYVLVDAIRYQCAPSQVHQTSPSSGYYINGSSFGIRYWPGLGKLPYLYHGIKSYFVDYKPFPVEYTFVRPDGTQSVGCDRPFLFAVMNGRYFGGGLRVAAKAAPMDGKANLVNAHDMPFWRVLTSFLPGALFNWVSSISIPQNMRSGEVIAAQVQPLFDNDEILLEVDGEVAGVLPVRYQVVSNAIRFILPQF
ncbi:hypothetical protein EV182_004831, partial [Spiromyces aspiralis]